MKEKIIAELWIFTFTYFVIVNLLVFSCLMINIPYLGAGKLMYYSLWVSLPFWVIARDLWLDDVDDCYK